MILDHTGAPDGKRLTFVRDYGDDTAVVIKYLDSG
jgi:hypothetical protein